MIGRLALGGNAQSDSPRNLDVVKTIDNSKMIVGPIDDACYFSIAAALSAIWCDWALN